MTITTKGSKVGKTQIRFLIGIAHDAGVVLCERIQVEGRLKGVHYAAIIKSGVFDQAINQTKNPAIRVILQDNDPVQNSGIARKAFAEKNIALFQIPARSPDINCIENYFSHVKTQLKKDALEQNITKETKDEFCNRVKQTMRNWDKVKINNLINSLPTRIEKLIKAQGDHIPY